MKVRVTFDVDFDDRLVIGIAQNNEFKPASREDVESFMLRAYDSALVPGRVKLQEFYEAIALDVLSQVPTPEKKEK